MFGEILTVEDLAARHEFLVITKSVAKAHPKLLREIRRPLLSMTDENTPVFILRVLRYDAYTKMFADMVLGITDEEDSIREFAFSVAKETQLPVFQRILKHPLTGEEYNSQSPRFIEL